MNKGAKNLVYVLFIFVILVGGYVFFEPKSASATSANTGVAVTQDVTSGINLDCDTSVILTPSFPSNPSGLAPVSAPALGSMDCLVVTNESNGYALSIKNQDFGASGVSLTHNTDNSYKFTNYQATPTYNWTDPSAGNAIFGFTIGAGASTPAAASIDPAFKNNGSACGIGSSTNDIDNMVSSKCWRGLNDITYVDVVNGSGGTTINGDLFRFRFQARANAIRLKAGEYTTTLTLTATN